ncbi:hypothetical protein BDZ85DRAFT_320665 [Elsinoe ampelina]|uniref:Rhodopsin domain-containing protein n=1 Tax=Elsinoe ampelina TaxID=302913 RepID=A0A6A6G767_9PEZI|nr:hypothetical protein BDZ85DRAFT_320665 [Elsinoe ampelina]
MKSQAIGYICYAAIITAFSTATVILRFFFHLAPAVNVIIFESVQDSLLDETVFDGDLPREPTRANVFFALSYAFFALYGLSISFTKWAILLFYWRLFNLTLGAVVTWLAQCRPVSRAWNILEPGTCINFYLFALLITTINLISDIIILILPMPIIWHLNTTLGKKISLMCAFGVGGFVCVVTAVRLHLTVQGGSAPKFASSVVLAWTLAEVSTAVICANLPFIYSLCLHYLPPSVRKIFRHGYTSKTQPTVDGGGYGLHRTKSHRQPSVPLSVFRQDSNVSDDQVRIISTSPSSMHKLPEDDAIYMTREFDVRR